MTEQEPLDELPEALQQVLRELSGVRAPAELRQRLEVARLPEVRAPEELWARVAPEVAAEALRLSGRRRLLQFPRRRWAAAAAVLLAGTSIALFTTTDRGAKAPALAAQVSESERAAYRARVQVRHVEFGELTESARALVSFLAAEEVS